MAKRCYYVVYEDFSLPRPSNTQVIETSNELTKLFSAVTLIFPYGNSASVNQSIEAGSTYLFAKPFAKLFIFNIIRFGWRCARYLATQKPDTETVVYARHSVLLPLLVYCQSRWPKMTIAYESHRLVGNAVSKWCERRLLKRGARFITISDHLRQQYAQRYGVEPDTILVAHDGVSVEAFSLPINQAQARQQLGITLTTKHLAVYAGTLWLVKGVDLIIAAANELPSVTFCLVGKLNADFAEWLQKNGTPKNVIIVPPVEQATVATYLRAADCLLIPHPKNNLSQSPLKAFEYLASGTPIVAARLPNLEEILPPDTIWFEPGSKKDFVQAINSFCENPEKYQASGNERIAIAKTYSWQARAERIYSFVTNHA